MSQLNASWIKRKLVCKPKHLNRVLYIMAVQKRACPLHGLLYLSMSMSILTPLKESLSLLAPRSPRLRCCCCCCCCHLSDRMLPRLRPWNGSPFTEIESHCNYNYQNFWCVCHLTCLIFSRALNVLTVAAASLHVVQLIIQRQPAAGDQAARTDSGRLLSLTPQSQNWGVHDYFSSSSLYLPNIVIFLEISSRIRQTQKTTTRPMTRCRLDMPVGFGCAFNFTYRYIARSKG